MTIKTDPQLSQFVADTCAENGICVQFDDGIEADDYVIIKVDDYYNSLHLSDTPPSVDCLIVQQCIENGFGLTLVELKAIDKANRIDETNIEAKFNTTLNNFIKVRYAGLLDIEYKRIRLYFVSQLESYKRDISLKMELLMEMRFSFNGRRLMLEPHMPNPAIKKCYGDKAK